MIILSMKKGNHRMRETDGISMGLGHLLIGRKIAMRYGAVTWGDFKLHVVTHGQEYRRRPRSGNALPAPGNSGFIRTSSRGK
jgi:hypothetical protein